MIFSMATPFVWISSEYGSAVVRRSSWSLRGSVPLSPRLVTCIQPLSGIKLVISLFTASYLRQFFDLLTWTSGHPRADSYLCLSTDIKDKFVTIAYTIIRIFIFDLSIVCNCLVCHLKSNKKPQKIPIAFWWHFYPYGVVFIKLLVTICIYIVLSFLFICTSVSIKKIKNIFRKKREERRKKMIWIYSRNGTWWWIG